MLVARNVASLPKSYSNWLPSKKEARFASSPVVCNNAVCKSSSLRVILNWRPLTNQNAGESRSALTEGSAISPKPTLV